MKLSIDRRGRMSLAALALGLGAGGYALDVARAQGIPTTQPLIYRGVVESTAGGIASGTHMIGVSLWNNATDTASGARLCSTSQSVALAGGHFEMVLDPACLVGVRGTADVWVELAYDGTTLSPRTKLGAVPYAVESDHAVAASSASAATGALQTQIAALAATNADLTSRLVALEGFRDCPRGYTKDASVTAFTLCTRALTASGSAGTRDEMVRVGSGASAFWIDRYEASAWGDANGAGIQYGAVGASENDNYPAGFPDNGQVTTLVYALSRAGVIPSADLTWFQANEACRASGKRFPSRDEWLAAARGTPDNSFCNTNSSAAQPPEMFASCQSNCGARNMIGNVWEWTNEWYAGLGSMSDPNAYWGTDPNADGMTLYRGDGTYNIASAAYPGYYATKIAGLPAAARRGGSWDTGVRAGVFALNLGIAPSNWYRDIGFRCVSPG